VSPGQAGPRFSRFAIRSSLTGRAMPALRIADTGALACRPRGHLLLESKRPCCFPIVPRRARASRAARALRACGLAAVFSP